MDHDVRTCDAGSAEESTIVRGFRKVVLQEVEVRLEFRIHERGVDLGSDAVGDGLEEEGDGRALDILRGLASGCVILHSVYLLPVIKATIKIVKSEPSE
jgi:hypothetical protein